MRSGKSESAASRRLTVPSVDHPMLATLIEAPFDDDGWLFETKWDGVRAIATVRDRDDVELRSRTGHDLIAQFPELRAMGRAFRGLPVVVDGEIVSLDRRGKSSFQRLQPRLGRAQPDQALVDEVPATYVAFDLLYASGRDLRAAPLEQRKRLLERALKARANVVLYSRHVNGQGKAFYRLAERHGLEGIIGKRRDSRYLQKRSRDWVKIKTQQSQEFVIGGWTEPRGSRKLFGALLLGLYDDGRLRYVGHVGTGFDRELLHTVMNGLKKIPASRSPFVDTPKTNAPSHWVKPKLVAEIKFGEWTRDRVLRQPVFLGLRSDKKPRECVLERPKRPRAPR